MDHTGVKTALARVMSRNNWFPALVQEQSEDFNSITRETIVEKIEAKAESLGVASSMVAKDLILCQLRTLAQEVTKDNNHFRKFEELAGTMGYLVKRKILVGTEVEETFLQEPLLLSLPLLAIWRMSHARVVSLELVIKSIYESKNKNDNRNALVDQLLDLLLNKGASSSIQAASDILAILVSLMYTSGSSQEWLPLSKFAGEVLHSLTEGVLDAVLGSSDTCQLSHKWQKDQKLIHKQPVEEHQKKYSQNHQQHKQTASQEDGKVLISSTSEVINMYQLVLENPRVPPEALEGFLSAQLVQVLTHRPNIKLSKVLKGQEAWCSAKANRTLVALMQKLVVGLGHEEALGILELVLSNEEVNWGCVLTLVATALTCHSATATKLKGLCKYRIVFFCGKASDGSFIDSLITLTSELIEQNIRRGCEELEVEPMVVGFLLARHAGQEGQHVFPSYVRWFSSLFTSTLNNPAAQKQSFVFLIRFLTDMVPHEPAYCLRAHLTSRIFIPKGCQEILQSYTHLARARLQELKETLQDGTQRQSSKTKAIEDVEAAVKHFSETGKLPSFVMEAAIFQEAYFRSSFLPALLAPRHLPEVPDARAKLIEALHSRRKISNTMLGNYTEACRKEAADLLQGIFVDAQEDFLMEEPIAELSSFMEELVVTHHKKNYGDDNEAASEVLRVLSKISLKLEEMMKCSDNRFKNTEYIILDPQLYDERLLSSQIVDQIISTLKRLLPHQTDEDSGENGRPEWLSQFFSLFSTSVTLQRSLSVVLLRHLSLQNLTNEQLRIDGIILFELHKIEGLFLPVVEATQPHQVPCSFTTHYLHKMNLDTPTSLHQACCILSSWLEWHIMCEGDAASLPTDPLHLYLSLAPRLPLLLNHSEGNEVTAADVYNYLNGNSGPECCRLYFSDDLMRPDLKIPLETWIQFEAKAAWGDVPLEVRQTFLYSRLLGNVSLSEHFIFSSEPHPATLEKLVAALVFSLAVHGISQCNSSDLFMLMQTAAQQCKDMGFCLLEAWHSAFTAGKMDSRSTLSYMSICRCLSPALFLRADRLLELAEVFQKFVSVLMSVTDMVQLSLCDTTFLCASVFAAAANPCVKNIHIELCLKPIRLAVVFHWDSLRSFLGNHITTITRHEYLKLLFATLDTDTSDMLPLLGPEESGVRLLSLSLTQAACNKIKDAIAHLGGKTYYLKWLLACLGLQQLRGNVPFLLSEGESLNVTKLDSSVMVWSYKELLKLLETKTAKEVTGDIFPTEEETHIGLKLVPVACMFVVMCGKDGHLDNDGNKNEFEEKYMDILLQCNNLVCQIFDSQSNLDDSHTSSGSSRKRIFIGKRWLPDLDYLSLMHQKIISYISDSCPLALSSIPKSTLLKCDSEIRATVYSRLQSKQKC